LPPGDLDLEPRQTAAEHAEAPRGRFRNVEHTPAPERPTVVDSNEHLPTVGRIGDPQQCAQWQRRMGCG